MAALGSGGGESPGANEVFEKGSKSCKCQKSDLVFAFSRDDKRAHIMLTPSFSLTAFCWCPQEHEENAKNMRCRGCARKRAAEMLRFVDTIVNKTNDPSRSVS